MIQVVVGDLADQDTEGVVRPIRSDLAPVTTASRDLSQRAGEELEERLKRIGALPLGGAVITPAGELPCSFLIHVVVMSQEEPQSSTTVRKALENGLRRAVDWGLESLAVPPLGFGVGTMEPEEAARVLCEILIGHVDEGLAPLDVRIVAASDFEAQLLDRFVPDRFRHRGEVGQ